MICANAGCLFVVCCAAERFRHRMFFADAWQLHGLRPIRQQLDGLFAADVGKECMGVGVQRAEFELHTDCVMEASQETDIIDIGRIVMWTWR